MLLIPSLVKQFSVLQFVVIVSRLATIGRINKLWQIRSNWFPRQPSWCDQYNYMTYVLCKYKYKYKYTWPAYDTINNDQNIIAWGERGKE